MAWYAINMRLDSAAPVLRSIGLTCRSVAVCLLSGWVTGRGFDDVERRLSAAPIRDQVLVVGATLLALFLAALLAAQAGVVGLALYGVAVVVLAR
jgi:hypothetical protein